MTRVHHLLALTWLAMATITSASTTTEVNPHYRVRGVVTTRSRRHRSLQASKVDKKSAKVDHVHERSYPPPGEFAQGRSSKAAEDSSGRSGDCVGSRSGNSKAKGASGRSGRSGGGKGGKGGRNRERGLKSKSGSSGSRQGELCTEDKSNKSGLPSREYPASFDFDESKGSGKKGAKGEGSSILSASSADCARDGSGSSSKVSKRGRTRGLKKGKGGGSGGRSGDGCAESVSGSNKGRSEGKSDKATKAKSGAASLPGRDYPDYGTVEQASGAESGGPVPKGAAKDSTASNSVGVVEAARAAPRSPVPCMAIAEGQVPSVESDQVQQYEISADMEINMPEGTTVEDFYGAFQTYLQKEVALDIAGCYSPDNIVATKLTGVVVQTPFADANKACQMSEDSYEAFDWADETETVSNRQGAEEGKDEAAAATEQGGSTGCHHIVTRVDIYHSADATPEDIANAKAALQMGISNANMDVLLGVQNPVVTETTDSYSSSAARASLETSPESSGKKVGFSLGMVGLILVMLATMKVLLNRKRNAQSAKDLYADMSDDDEDIDDATFIYPTEEELLGPEFGDLEFDETAQEQQQDVHGAPKNSSFILEDLQDGASVGTGYSYASSQQNRVQFREVAPTPDSLRRKGCC